MTSSELRSWRGKRSRAEVAALLGCSERALQNWEGAIYVIPRYISLAIAALQFNLPPYGSK